MSCVLRIFGEHLDIDALLAYQSLVPVAAWKKGEQGSLKGRVNSNSGVNFGVSDAEFEEFSLQLSDATLYLALNSEQIQKIVSFEGVEEAILDFPVSTSTGFVTQTSAFPPVFVQHAARLGLGLCVSHYPTCEDDD